MYGQLILSLDAVDLMNNSIDISKLPAGNYIAKIINADVFTSAGFEVVK
jgi:hypothetical protein